MFRNLGKALCLIMLSALVLSSSYGGEKLRYQMAKGSTYKYILTGDTKTNVQANGQDMATNLSNYFAISLNVESTGPDVVMLIAKVDSNKSKIESMMMKDSAMVMKEINGKRIRLTLSPLGKITKSVPIDSIVPSRAMQMMGGGNPADFLRQLFVKLPEQAVGVGETWKYTSVDTMNAQGMTIISKPDMTFKLVGSEKMGGYDCFRITFEGTASVYGTGSRQGMEMVVDGTTKSKGTTYFAPKEGVLVSVENESSSDMNISGSGEQMFTATQSTKSAQKMKLAK
jgi:hypothetical protein